MKRRSSTLWLVVFLVGVFGSFHSVAQNRTITTGTLEVSEICVGSSLTVPFTTTGNFNNAVFTAQLSSATGDFTTPTNLSPSGGISPLFVTIPVDVPAGTNYRIRVVSTGPNVTGSESETILTIGNTQSPPVVSKTTYGYCVGETATPLTATATTGNTLKWFDGNDNLLAGAPTPTTTSAGTQTYKVSQISAAGCESEKVTITVTVGARPTAPTAPSPIALCQGATASPLTATGTNLLWYLPNGTTTTTAPTPVTTTAGTQQYGVTQTVDGCESTQRTITVNVTAAPAAPGVTSPVTYCYNATATALTATGTNLLWYLPNGTTSTTAPTPGTTQSATYQVTQRVDGCESDKATINVVINRTAAPTVVSPVVYCASDAASQLTANGTALRWYTVASGGTGSTTAPTPSTINATSNTIIYTYYVSQTLNGCESDVRAELEVRVNPRPAAPGTSNIAYCQNATTLSLVATGTNLLWYGTNATGGTGSATAPVPSSATVGTTSYYVTQTNAQGCESATRAKLDVTINAAPAAPATPSTVVEYCQGATASALTATATDGNTLRWYTVATGGTGVTTAPVPLTTTPGDVNYYVSQVNTASGCESTRTLIKVTTNPTPPALTARLLEYCQTKVSKDTVLFITPATGNTVRWYAAATGGTALVAAPTIDLKDVKDYTYYATQVTAKGCESSTRAKIDAKVKPRPVPPSVITPVGYCQGATASALVAAASPGGTLNWYGLRATGGTATTTATVPSTTIAGDTAYYVSQTVSGCESDRAAITVSVRATPLPTVTAKIEYCKDTKGVALTATGDNLRWYNDSTGGTSFTTAPTPITTTVGTVDYFVTQTRSYTVGTTKLECESKRAKIDVVINALPAAPAVTNVDECQTKESQTITLKATATTGNTLKWYTVATGGTGVTTVPSINLNKADTSSYYVAQVSSKLCESNPRAQLKVRVKRLPGIPAVTAQLEFCQFDTPNPLSATLESGGVANWYGSASGGTRSGSAPVPTTQEGGTISYFVSQSLLGCEGDRAEIRVLTKTTPKPTVTSPLTYCQNATTTPLSAQGEKLKWYRTPTTTESQTTPFTPFTANVGDFSFYVTQTGSNGCESPKEEIRVRVRPLPSATISGDNSIVLGQQAEITLSFTGDGPWSYQLSNGVSGQTSQSTLRIPVSPQTTTTYLVTEVANQCGKGIPNGSAMITVRVPTITTGNPSTASLCAGRTFSLPFQASGDFVADNKFNVQIAPEGANPKFYTIPTVRSGNEAVATLPDTTRGGNYLVRVVGESALMQFMLAGSVSPVAVTVRPLPTATISGGTSILTGQSTNLSIAFTGEGPWTFAFRTGTRDSLVTTSVTPFLLTVRPAATTTYTVASVSNQCGTGRVVGTARVQVDPILGIEPVLKASWLTAYPNPVQTICVVEISAKLAAAGAQLRVYDLNGRNVVDRKVRTTRTEVDFSRLPSGVYFIRVENGEQSAVRQIIKQE
jgi:hypothetical protein